ncbi:unnamed protein product [Adineta ricciae]|uniref:F-box domain-containing protein n=1 Tax=Adineta ricciae TaxID=249248 RepID=A0A815ZKJ5_ADIRI|nr:unnamed protein product [Adineta ricciae]
MTCFDDLSIVLLCKIFDYLPFIELFQAFYGLQKRLDGAIQHYSACIRLSVLNIPETIRLQCKSLILSTADVQSFQIRCSNLNFEKLRAVKFEKINLHTLYSFIDKLPMKQLESIVVGRFTWYYYPRDFYNQVWTTMMDSISDVHLRYLHLPYHIRYWDAKKLSFDLLALECATLEYISTAQMISFVTRTPNLRQFKACITAPHRDLSRLNISLLKLQHLTLNLQDNWSLEQIQQLLATCPYLKYLNLKLDARNDMRIMFEPSTWQKLIEDKLLHLIFLRINLGCIVSDSRENDYQALFNQETYWYQRQPHFHVQIHKIQRNPLK